MGGWRYDLGVDSAFFRVIQAAELPWLYRGDTVSLGALSAASVTLGLFKE